MNEVNSYTDSFHHLLGIIPSAGIKMTPSFRRNFLVSFLGGGGTEEQTGV
jgi:hypothetical protein